ncbi:PREDICTED: ABC transporter B family member 4-like [Prunus mume]|uniref:ABC transporter B family member 4-like n=1 Tax=Prunus mume TaxID=102107 RepID=A0ABM1LIC5_PRUMU|nr:PREDICTED: ABC transporter B family member 4-like [Prunus mume]
MDAHTLFSFKLQPNLLGPRPLLLKIITWLDTIRLVVSLAAQNSWPVYQLDVKSAFLHGELNEKVFIDQPPGYVQKGNEKKVFRLKKALYRLKQAPRAWYSRIDAYFSKAGFQKCPHEHTLFVKSGEGGKFLIVCLYVDDLLFPGNDEAMFVEFKSSMMSEFDMTDLGKMRYFLGIEVVQSSCGIFISQRKYAQEVLERFRMSNCNPVQNPIVPSFKITRDAEGESFHSTYYKQIINNKDVVDAVSKVALKFVYLAVGAAAAAFLQMSCWMVTGERQASRIRSLYLKTILRQDVGFFDKEINTGEIVGRMSGDTVLIQEAMGEKVGSFIQLTATFVGGFAIAFIKGWLLTLVMLSSIPLLVLCGALMGILISKMASSGQTAYSVAATVVEQTIGSIRTVALFTGEKQAIANYNNSLIKAYNSGVQEGLASGFGMGTVMLIIMCSYALAIWFGGKMILEKGYTGGEVINIVFAVLTGSMSLGQASPCLSAFAAGQAAAYKMFETTDRKPEIDASDTNGKQLHDIRGDIELKDVYFSYPARPDEQIFHGFSLSIPSGATAALVGESGSGKSTVVSLIERFYDPVAGEILIDGINLKEFQLKWIRQKIGLVSQLPVLFTCSIKDNIAYGKDGATTEEIRAAAELANAAKFIDKLPQRLDTMVGEHGTQLSGGQKQRVAIARAILKDPRILLLDEATSALDAESESIVQEALDRIMINRTTVVVAHRLSTVRNADTIAVIHRGTIVEKGPHSELIKDPEGAYSQLIRLQEMSTVSEQTAVNEHERFSSVDSRRHSSQRFSNLRSISRESSGRGNSNRHSFSISYSVPTAVGSLETASAGHDIPASASSRVPPEVSLRRLAYLNKPEIPVLLLGTIAAAVNGVVLPIFAILISSVIKTFYEPPPQLRKDSKFWALIFIVLGVVTFIAMPARQYFFAVAGCKLIKRVRSMCYEKVVYMEVSWFDDPENSSGAIGARLSSDAASLRGLVGDALGLLVENSATAIAGLCIAFVACWQLALIILVLLPLLGLNGYVQVKFMKGFSADVKKMYEDASQVAHDAVGSIRTIASYCAEEKVIELYQKKCEGPIKTGIRRGLISGIGFGLSFFFLFSVDACSFYAGARLVAAGKTTFSDVFRVFFALVMTAVGVSQSGSLAPNLGKVKSSAASIFAILDRKSKIDSSDESGTTIENVKGHGKTVALVGESGSGKSTVISLLQRFYDPDSGHITLDGVEIQKLQLKWLRQQMGLVSQEPVLFNDTIRANIAYGKEGNATEAEIIAAAELANAHKFISSLQQFGKTMPGYDTIVGERGIQLSGGQKQRVAIARAIMKAPKILLLDEATSALDAESERVVQDALDQIMVDRTTIVVAHRLSTIKGADVIAVVKNGVVAEKGKHKTLIGIEDGIYASLVALHASASS